MCANFFLVFILKSSERKKPLSKYAKNEYMLTEIFLDLFLSGYAFKREKPYTRTQIKRLLYQFTRNFADYQTL